MNTDSNEFDRLFVTHDYRDDGVEIGWKADNSGILSPDDHCWNGTVYITKKGELFIRFNSHEDDTPYLFVLNKSGAKVVVSEDLCDPSPEAEVVFYSEQPQVVK